MQHDMHRAVPQSWWRGRAGSGVASEMALFASPRTWPHPVAVPFPVGALAEGLSCTCRASVPSAGLHSHDERPLTVAAPANPLASTIALGIMRIRVLAHRAENICGALSVGNSNDEATRRLV